MREALNAGINSLPDFPQPLDLATLQPAQQQAQDYRKQTIMSSFGQQQQLQQQPTSYGQPLGYQQTGYQQMNQQQPTGYQQQASYSQQQPYGYPSQTQQYYPS